MVTYLTEKEYTVLESLKTLTVNETAKEMNISSSNVYATLYRIRNKDEKSRNTINYLNNLKDSKKHPRLAKMLRRVAPILREKDD